MTLAFVLSARVATGQVRPQNEEGNGQRKIHVYGKRAEEGYQIALVIYLLKVVKARVVGSAWIGAEVLIHLVSHHLAW